MAVASYSIGTWDTELQAFTPQCNMSVPWLNVDRSGLRAAIRDLRNIGYSCHRRGNEVDGHDDNDSHVLIERTDGMTEVEILENWKR